MKRHVRSISVIIIPLLLLSLASCFHSDKLCCEQYSAESESATYCNNHRNAALKFVRFVTDNDERLARLGDFKLFYSTVEDCQTVECIEDAIAIADNLPGFADRYQTEHDFSENDTNLPQEEKAGLILCGFDQAIEGLEKTLEGEE